MKRKRPTALVLGVLLTSLSLAYLHLKSTALEAREVDGKQNEMNTVSSTSSSGLTAKSLSEKRHASPTKALVVKEPVRKAIALAEEVETDPLGHDQLEESLRLQVREFKASELSELKRVALDSELSMAHRQAALGVLKSVGTRAFPALSQFAASPFPSTTSIVSDERDLRMRALEALDEAAADGADVTNYLESVSSAQKDRVLAFLADTSLSNIAQGRAGSLNRMIAQLAEKKNTTK
jgi:hypothetical protein